MAKDRKRKRGPATPPPSPPRQAKQSALQVFYMAVYKVLLCLEPTEDEKKARETRIDELQKFVNIWRDYQEAIVEPYGSYMTGLYSKYGDVDVSLTNISGNPHDPLGYIFRMMKQKAMPYHVLEYRREASVPVLVFHRKKCDIPFDLTLGNYSGKINSHVLSKLKELNCNFRPTVLLVKEWARCHNIHQAYHGGFSSYALCMLVLFHFQTYEPPLFPPMSVLCTKDILNKIKDKDISWEDDFDKNVKKYTSETQQPDLFYAIFYGFMNKFKNIKHEARKLYISTTNGKWETREPHMQKANIWVEDPFGNNAARCTTQLTNIMEAFRETQVAIETETEDEILKKLASHELSSNINSFNWSSLPNY